MNVAAFATICNDDGEVLLIQRRDLDVWECPGGAAHSEETPRDAVVRETREETGLAIVVERLTGVYWRPTKSALVFQFLCRPAGGTPRLSEEAGDLRYFSHQALPDRLAPVVKERIADSFNHPGVFRMQEGPGAKEFIASLR